MPDDLYEGSGADHPMDYPQERRWVIWKNDLGQGVESGPHVLPDEDGLAGAAWARAAKVEVMPVFEHLDALKAREAELEEEREDWRGKAEHRLNEWRLRVSDALIAQADRDEADAAKEMWHGRAEAAEKQLAEEREARVADQQKANQVIAHWQAMTVTAGIRGLFAAQERGESDPSASSQSDQPPKSDLDVAESHRLEASPAPSPCIGFAHDDMPEVDLAEPGPRAEGEAMTQTGKLPTNHPLIRAEKAEAERDDLRSSLYDFIRESNLIEGIDRWPTDGEIKAHEEFLDLPEVRVPEMESFVRDVAARRLRDRIGMNVTVGSHRPPPGGPHIRSELSDLLAGIQEVGEYTPWAAHVAYEKLHPFLDGNGRSGRVLWAWHMRQEGHDPFSLPFLHRAYYQALEADRG